MSTATPAAPSGYRRIGCGALQRSPSSVERNSVKKPSTRRANKNSRKSGVKTPLISIAGVLTTPGAKRSGMRPGGGWPRNRTAHGRFAPVRCRSLDRRWPSPR
jgi:hypothetical protein